MTMDNVVSLAIDIMVLYHMDYRKKHVRLFFRVTGIRLIEIDRGSEVIYHDILAQLWRNYGAKIHFWRNYGAILA